jgi:hypothetical protein
MSQFWWRLYREVAKACKLVKVKKYLKCCVLIRLQPIETYFLDTPHIKMDLNEVGCDGVKCIQVAHSRFQWQTVVETLMILWIPLKGQVIF